MRQIKHKQMEKCLNTMTKPMLPILLTEHAVEWLDKSKRETIFYVLITQSSTRNVFSRQASRRYVCRYENR
jgi:hypothetical protein